jgi:hypothetical protein
VDLPRNQHLRGVEDVSYLWGSGYKDTVIYDGPLVAYPPQLAVLPLVTHQDLRPLGSTAIARCKPTNNVADLSLFLAELYRDGLPKLFGATLWKGRTSEARAAGEEYLNAEFGWKPLISDVHDIVHAMTHASDVLDAYERGSNQMVRRRYTFPVERTVSSAEVVLSGRSGRGFTPFGNIPLSIPDPLRIKGRPTSDILRMLYTWKQVWFSGAFTYHLPSDYKSRNALMSAGAKARTLLGGDLTPELLWNAAPWSWAVDWFSNAGDVISNLSDWANDGLVLKYGYVMEHSFHTYRYFANPPENIIPGGVVSPVSATLETKRREVASPFGFNVDWPDFTLRQKAIAAALGLTRR